MKIRTAAVLTLVILLSGMLAPALAYDSDALEKGDYYISIPGTDLSGGVVKTTINNGEMATWSVWVVNNSDKHLEVSYTYSLDNSDAEVTSIPSNTLLGPTGSSEETVSKGDFTIEISSVSGAHDSLIVKFMITVKDLSESSSLAEVNTIAFDINVESTYDSGNQYNKFFGIVPNTLSPPFNNPWITAIVTLLVEMLAILFVVKGVLNKLAQRTMKENEDSEKAGFVNSVLILVMPLSFFLLINQTAMILNLGASVISLLFSLTGVISVILGTVIMWRVYVFIVTSVLTNFEKVHTGHEIDSSLIPLFKMIGRLIFSVGGASLVLSMFGVDLQGILVSAGVISLGITLGAQNILSQFFSGIVLLINRPFRHGDFLKINGTVYIVRKVKLMYTEFNNWNNDEIITMPNNVVSSATISNMTKNDKAAKHFVFFDVAYGTDLDKAQEVMVEAAKKCPLVVQDGWHEGPRTRVTSLEGSGIQIRLSSFAPTFDDTGLAAGQLRELVLKAFAENDIEIPYDRLEVDIISDRNKGDKSD